MNLTAKQEAFALAYIQNGGNASAAYRQTYSAENMKPEVVNVKACELLKSGKVSVRIAELVAPAAKEAQLTAEGTLKELALAVHGDPEDALKWSDKLSAIDKAMKYFKMFKEDDRSNLPDIHVTIQLVG